MKTFGLDSRGFHVSRLKKGAPPYIVVSRTYVCDIKSFPSASQENQIIFFT